MISKEQALEALLCLTNVDSVEEYGNNFEIVETFLRVAHDDTALLRMALDALKELWDNFGVVCPSADLIDQYEAAITALRERLGEKA